MEHHSTFALIVKGPANGILGELSKTGAATAQVTYAPNANFNGRDSFDFQVDDGSGKTAMATATITIVAVNDVPTAQSQSVDTAEDTAFVITLAALDVDGDALAFSISQQPTNGTLGEIQTENDTLATVDYQPRAGFTGEDSIAFEVDDGNNGKQVGTIKITVKETNQPPQPISQLVSVIANTAKTIVLTGTDADGDPLTFIVTRAPTNGTLSEIKLKTNSSAEVIYTPNSCFLGEDGFEFKISDGLVTSDVTVVSLDIGGSNSIESTTYLPLMTLGN